MYDFDEYLVAIFTFCVVFAALSFVWWFNDAKPSMEARQGDCVVGYVMIMDVCVKGYDPKTELPEQ
jgi:hypothetical protein